MSQIKFYIHSGGKDGKTSLLFHRDEKGNYHVCIHDKIAHSKHYSTLNFDKQTIEEKNISKIVGFDVYVIKCDDEKFSPEIIYTDFIYDILTKRHEKIKGESKIHVSKIDEKVSGILGVLNNFYDLKQEDFSKNEMYNKIIGELKFIILGLQNDDDSDKKSELKELLEAFNGGQIPYGEITQRFDDILPNKNISLENFASKKDFLEYLNEFENNESNFNFINTINKSITDSEIPENTSVCDFHVFFERVIGMKILREMENFEPYVSKSKKTNLKYLEIDGYKEEGKDDDKRYYLIDFKFKRETSDDDLYKSIIYSLFFFEQIKEKNPTEEKIVGLMIFPIKENKIKLEKVYQFGDFYFFDIGYPIDKILANEYEYDECCVFSIISNIVKDYYEKRSKNKDSHKIILEDGRLITTQRFGFKSLKSKKT